MADYMERHTFEVTLAWTVGLRPAIIYDFLREVCRENSRFGVDIHDGVAWVRLPMRRFKRIFPYMCEKSIRSSIKKLVDKGLVKVGHYDEDHNITNWYSVG